MSFIDIYNHHGMRWERYTEHIEPRMAKWMRKAKEQGSIKHICCSFHDNNEALRKLVDTGYVESITLQYNLLDRGLEDGIAYAHEKGLGVVVMGPVGGGRLGADSEVLAQLAPGIARVPELALRFVLSNSNVSLALSGMSTMQQVEENLATAADAATLTEEQLAAISEHLERLRGMAELYCSGCGYCQPCAHEVRIPDVFGLYNMGRVYGLWDVARSRYARAVERGRGANLCIECGECEVKCPQKLPIRAQFKEAHAALTE